MKENKINAAIVLKNNSDKHLNVFWQYNGKPDLENNITKALINTFDSLALKNKREFIKSLFSIKLDEDIDYTFTYFLQKIPLKN